MYKWNSRSYANVSGLQIALIIALLRTSQHLEIQDNYKHIIQIIDVSKIYIKTLFISSCHKHKTILLSCYI